MKTHLIIIKESLLNQELFENLNIIGEKKSSQNNWTLCKIDISKNPRKISNKLRKFLNEKFYFHYYTSKNLFVVFKYKTFKVTKNKKSWQKVIEYGTSLKIPKEQLDFFPKKFVEETY